ncbi:MAG: ribosome silencing factor [Candidatus Omnitrophica bacterium]|nr:ribosome silencing factor [Candidatus Omnitrophota bacterium]
MTKKSSVTSKKPQRTSKKTIQLIAELALSKKAEDLVVLDIRKVANFCDYFIICSGNSDRQVKAIADGMREGLSEQGTFVARPQGYRDAKWIIIDIGDVVVHVFEKQAREFYGLEYLWQGGKKIDWQK